jgi:3-isopropylmalate dehydratase small subunit
VECDTSTIREGDRLVVDLTTTQLTVRNETQQTAFAARALPVHMLRILDAGGLVPYFRAHRGFEEAQ